MRLLLSAVLIAFASQALGSPCSDRIAFVRGVIDRDLKTGFIGKDVHAGMTRDLDAAGQACRAGKDGQAQLLVSSTQTRHGYPVR